MMHATSLRLLRTLQPSYTYVARATQTRRAHNPSAHTKERLFSKELPPEVLIEPFGKYIGLPDLKPGTVLSQLTPDQLLSLLTVEDPQVEKGLFAHADSVSQKFFGPKVYFRGIVEFSNVCQKNCGYCGLRKEIPADQLHRYTMKADEILACAEFCFKSGYGSIMLQSGELATENRVMFLEHIIQDIKKRTKEMERDARSLPKETPLDTLKGLGVALSVGELPSHYYQRLFDAGAHRYLLRIETSNPKLYAKLHPPDHSWETRVNCLRELRRIGFQVGTGVMIGVPEQTMEDLVNDLRFFKEIGADMIGMGPYVYHGNTPVGDMWKAEHTELVGDQQVVRQSILSDTDVHGGDKVTISPEMKAHNQRLLQLTTRMYALARVYLGDVNIPSTTALQAIDPVGRELGLQRGANVLMPILTPTSFRKEYQLYQGKPCIDEGAAECHGCLMGRLKWVGKEAALGVWGDPVHYFSSRGMAPEHEVPVPTKQDVKLEGSVTL